MYLKQLYLVTASCHLLLSFMTFHNHIGVCMCQHTWAFCNNLVDLKPCCFFTPTLVLHYCWSVSSCPLLSQLDVTAAMGPDIFTVDWSRWAGAYLFPPPNTTMMLHVCWKLLSFYGQILLTAPFWPAQTWFPQLLQWCHQLLPLGRDALANVPTSSQFSLGLHAWSFCVKS